MYFVIYAVIWVLAAGTAGILLATGQFSEVAAAAYGFLFTTLFFAGLVAGLPWWLDRLFAPKY